MSDTYYADQPVLSHICPFCDTYQLEAPDTWDLGEIQGILREHVQSCVAKPNWGAGPYRPVDVTFK